MKTRLEALLQSAQPNAVAFGGAGISNNPVRWCGTEGGDPPGWPTIWATDCGAGWGSGCPTNSTGAVWNPSGVDFTLQQGDVRTRPAPRSSILRPLPRARFCSYQTVTVPHPHPLLPSADVVL